MEPLNINANLSSDISTASYADLTVTTNFDVANTALAKSTNGLTTAMINPNTDFPTTAENNVEITQNFASSPMGNWTTTSSEIYRDSKITTTTPGVTGLIDTGNTMIAWIDGNHNNTAEIQAASSSSSGWVIGVVIAILVLIAALAAFIFYIYRKRRSSKDDTHVYQVPATHKIPKERTTWHEVNEGAADNHGFNPDLELQPSDIFHTQNINIEDDTECLDQPSSRSFNNRESVVFNKESKSFKLRHENETKSTHSGELGEGNELSETELSGKEMDFKGDNDGQDSHYSFAKPFIMGEANLNDEESVDDSNNGTNENDEETENEGDMESVVTAITDNVNGNEITSENEISFDENERDSYYTNVDIRRVQSMQVPQSSQRMKETGEYLPRRIGSETKVHSSKPPIAQPRNSRKKSFDPYDYPPGLNLPVRGEITEDTDTGLTNNNWQDGSGKSTLVAEVIHERETDSDCESDLDDKDDGEAEDVEELPVDTEHLEEDTIYDYPRTISEMS